jgi:hypothetical protein
VPGAAAALRRLYRRGVDPDRVRDVAVALPEVEEYEHGGRPAFRVRGKRFASVLGADGVNLMLDEHAIRVAAAEWPAWCVPQTFGDRLAALRVLLPEADPAVVEHLVTAAWRRRAPRTVVRAHDG